MKRKIIALCVVAAMLAVAIVSGTLAYFTDTDGAVNVMTVGSVKIKQIEEEWNADKDKLVKFKQNKELLPYVGTPGWENRDADGGAYRRFTMKNVIDKYVTVENTGKSDAFVRTFIALEMGGFTEAEFNMIGVSINAINGSEFKFDGAWEWTDEFVAEIEGQNYYVMVAVHKDALKPGDTTIPSLLQVYLKNTATNEDAVKLDGNKNGTYDVLAFTEAVQAKGFENAEIALATAFGDTSAPTNYHPWEGRALDWSTIVSSVSELREIIKEANGEPVAVKLGESFEFDATLDIPSNVSINGGGNTISRADGFTGTMFNVLAGGQLTLADIVVDGGAEWSGNIDPTLGRATTNIGVTATGNLVATTGDGSIVLGKDAVLQNNVGAHAVSLATRGGGSLTLNGAQIINNESGSGAIWGGGAIIINEGSKISGNSSTGLAGVIRMVGSCNFTMNGGEITHNKAAGDGGVIWGYGASHYTLAGGEIAYNVSEGAGGVIYSGTYSQIDIANDIEIHDNSAVNSGAIRLTDHTSLTMTGGKIYNNKQGAESNAFNTWNNSISIIGGSISDNISYVGGLGLTIGAADIDGVISYGLSTNHNTAYLKKDFGSFKFTVDESNANFANFNFKPEAGYVYTSGDEGKLICMNDGYSTYWDAASGTFRLKAN